MTTFAPTSIDRWVAPDEMTDDARPAWNHATTGAISMSTAPSHSPSREQLLYWLHEASEIEHNLMCCYLYAAFSLKRADPNWSDAQAEAVHRWRDVIMSVAFEEMTHLALVANIAQALGAGAHMGRPAFPTDAGPYPAGFVIRLQPFSAGTIEHFKFLERPADQELSDADGFAPRGNYRRHVPEGRLSPGPRDYATVGELYRVLQLSLEACAESLGEKGLFTGDPSLQVDASLAPLPGIAPVTDLRSALAAISTIVTQGEGAGSEEIDSHFSRFSRIGVELSEMLVADPAFEPAWPAATNPVMNPPVHSSNERVHISEPRMASWLDIGNALYTTSLRCLLQGLGARDRRAKATWLGASFALMRAVVPVGEGLAARPAQPGPGSVHAGLTFTPLRTLSSLPHERGASFVEERLAQLRQRATELPLALVAGESEATWQGVIDLLAAQESSLRALWSESAGSAPSADQAHAQAWPAFAATSAEAPNVEVARGRALTLFFDSKRCIHSRHCVLDAPGVFKANTPGEWIFPDAVPSEAVVAVANNCPSGAIRFARHDGGAEEGAPVVNQMRIRENGPYAFHAMLSVDGRPDGYRATLCRCGHSSSKPWCDGTHARIGFEATGEPKSLPSDALRQRGGPLEVLSLRNGPLRVSGNLEICAGTGRTVTRVTEARLCRCGHSKSKPFCDLSHVSVGFSADGA